MKIHHIGYLVDNIDNAATAFEGLGLTRNGEIVKDAGRGAYILFLSSGGQTVELIQPVDETSPLYKLRKKYRNTPYHICCETDSLQSKIEEMEKNEWGGVLIQPPQPAPAIPGCPDVAFMMNRHIGIIELVEVKTNE